MVDIIAELTINHLGMKKIAEATIRRCKEIGVDYVKIKKKNVKKYYKPGKKFRGYDFLTYRNSMEFSEEDISYLNDVCKDLDIPWFSTVHDKESFDIISQYDVPFYKIASMDALDEGFIKEFASLVDKDKPLIVSTGGKNLNDIRKVVDIVRGEDLELILNHVVSIYPTPVDKCNIEFIYTLRKEFEDWGVQIGYSGHEYGWVPTLMAVTAGAKFIERHITLSKDLKIHHIEAGLTSDEFGEMVSDIRDLESIMKSDLKEYEKDEYLFLIDRKYE